MGCSLGCGAKYRSLRSATAAPKASVISTNVRRKISIGRRGIVRKADREPLTSSVVTPPTEKPIIVPRPDTGPTDPSTGIKESIIKTGTDSSQGTGVMDPEHTGKSIGTGKSEPYGE